MGFFGRVALGSALGGLAKDMKENREYARDKSERIQDYLYQRGLERRQKVQEKRNEMQAAVDFLEREGLEVDKIKALLAENPMELLNLAVVAKDFKNKAGNLTPTILNQAVTVGQGFDGVEATASELIAAAMPDFVEGADLKKPKDERTILQKFFRGATNEEIMYDAYSQDILGGEATGADIAASINAPIIKRGTGSSVSTSYVGLGKMDIADISGGQRVIRDQYDELAQIRLDELNEEAGRLEREGAGPEAIQANSRKIEELKRIQKIADNKERLEALMQFSEIGFGKAQEFYAQFPQVFNDQLMFVDQDLIPYISGQETFEYPPIPPVE